MFQFLVLTVGFKKRNNSKVIKGKQFFLFKFLTVDAVEAVDAVVDIVEAAVCSELEQQAR